MKWVAGPKMGNSFLTMPGSFFFRLAFRFAPVFIKVLLCITDQD